MQQIPLKDGGVGGVVSAAAAAARTGSGVESVGGAQARDPPVSVRTRRDPMADSVGGAATVSAWRPGIAGKTGAQRYVPCRRGNLQGRGEGSAQTRVHKTNSGSRRGFTRQTGEAHNRGLSECSLRLRVSLLSTFNQQSMFHAADTEGVQGREILT